MQNATVLACHDDGTADVIVPREAACGGKCSGCAGCGTTTSYLTVRAKNTIGAAEGERVVIKPRNTVFSFAAAFGIPFVLLILGVAVPSGLGYVEEACALSGLICLGLGLLMAKLINGVYAKRGEPGAVILHKKAEN